MDDLGNFIPQNTFKTLVFGSNSPQNQPSELTVGIPNSLYDMAL